MLNIVVTDIFHKKKKKLGLKLHNQHSHKIPDLCDRWLRKKKPCDWAAEFYSAKPINSADLALKNTNYSKNSLIYIHIY